MSPRRVLIKLQHTSGNSESVRMNKVQADFIRLGFSTRDTKVCIIIMYVYSESRTAWQISESS